MGVVSKNTKYGNKKIVVNGVKFDSKLEYSAYNLMKMLNIKFDFQVPVTLIPKFRFNGSAIREIGMVVDFVIYVDNSTIYLDTKGFPTEVANIKYKMLKNMLKDEESVDVVWVKNQKELKGFINKITENV